MLSDISLNLRQNHIFFHMLIPEQNDVSLNVEESVLGQLLPLGMTCNWLL